MLHPGLLTLSSSSTSREAVQLVAGRHTSASRASVVAEPCLAGGIMPGFAVAALSAAACSDGVHTLAREDR